MTPTNTEKAWPAPCGEKNEWGQFCGRVAVVWQSDGREMRLLEDFLYVDPDGVPWDAPANAYIDGASIPSFLWSAVGSPYTGQYRFASVVHDIACCREVGDWRNVHRMFYKACRCAGVPSIRAKVMYAAVYAFGPKWGKDALTTRQFTPREFDELYQWIEANDPPIEAIEAWGMPGARKLICFKEQG